LPSWDLVPSLLSPKTRLVAVGHVSNVTGAIAPVSEIVTWAHARGVPVLLDAAQSISHLPIDVRALGVDFLAASAHKAFGPSGVGFLYAERSRMAKLPLYQLGGGMVAVNEDLGAGEFLPLEPPFRFEAGTPAIEATIGFGEAIRWMRSIGMENIAAHDRALSRYLFAGLASIPGVRVLASDLPAEDRIALATFVVEAPGMTQENVARALSDMFGVCVSGGYHCAHVLHARTRLAGTVRASPHVFNRSEDIDRLVFGLTQIAG
jgi:cysteine desulfurase/selenocysteine lyase